MVDRLGKAAKPTHVRIAYLSLALVRVSYSTNNGELNCLSKSDNDCYENVIENNILQYCNNFAWVASRSALKVCINIPQTKLV